MKGLSFIVSDKCNITCDFCAPGCGPKLKGHLTSEFMIGVFEQLRAVMPVANVVFTGGEPTLFRNDILLTLRHIKEVYPVPTRIVTNAYWGRNEKKARDFVSELKAAGLTEFNFSVDDFHQKYIDLNAIKTAIQVSLDQNVPVLLAHKIYPGCEITKDTFDELMGFSIPIYEELTPEQHKNEPLCISTGATIPVGRGADDIDLNEWVPIDTPPSHWAGPCREVLKNITVQADGSFTPCCGIVERRMPVFYMGDLNRDRLSDVLEQANASTIYNWLALEGPEGIMHEIQKRSSEEKFLGRYLQNCQLCQEIFSSNTKKKIIADSLEEKGVDLAIKRTIFEVMRNVAPPSQES